MWKLAASHSVDSTYIIIDTEQCKGCRYCISVCPRKIIESASKINKSGYIPAAVIPEKAGLCTGCLSCAVMCPEAAISVYKRNIKAGQ